MAPQQSRPDILVAESGRLVAVRRAGGGLVPVPGHRQKFELMRWLEHDGDAATVAEAQTGSFFRCDPAGCTIEYKGFYIAVSKSPASLGDDCRRAHLLILPYPKPAACEPASGAIDFWQLRDGGTHAIAIDGAGSILIAKVEDYRGDRPWTQKKQHSQRRRKTHQSK